MGTSYLQSKNLNKRKVIKLLTLKDGRLSAVFDDSIEIYSLNNFNVELLIDGGTNLRNLTQLNNDKLIISSYYSERNKPNKVAIIAITKIISLDNNSYSIVQTLKNDYTSEKILEKDNLLFSFEQNILFDIEQTCGKSCINIYEKSNNEYTKTKTKKDFIKIGDNNWCLFVDACFINNNEIMVVLINRIQFLDIINMEWTHEITNYYNNRQAGRATRYEQSSQDLICNLNDNLYLIGGDNKFYIIDVIRHEIQSIINLENEKIIIKNIKKDLNNKIYVLMDNNYQYMKDYYTAYDYFCVYT